MLQFNSITTHLLPVYDAIQLFRAVADTSYCESLIKSALSVVNSIKNVLLIGVFVCYNYV